MQLYYYSIGNLDRFNFEFEIMNEIEFEAAEKCNIKLYKRDFPFV